MSTLEEFEAAPVGATARSPYRTVVKTELSFAPWVDEAVGPNGKTRIVQSTSDQLVRNGFTLDPAPAAPTSAREALDLAWELAHPVKEGQAIPAGTDYLLSRNGERPATMRANLDQFASKTDETNRRTLDPLPEPTPEWLTAPAVIATCERCKRVGMSPTLRSPFENGLEWLCALCADQRPWSDLADVIPLYPKEDA